jgi:beta-glucosidase
VRKSRRALPLRRRDFLFLAMSGAAAVAASWPESDGLSNTVPAQAEPQVLDTGGIALEHFEDARKRAAAIVKKLTLAEKILQFDAGAAAVPRLSLRAFSYYGAEALHGLMHSGPITSFPVPLALGCSWNRALVEQVFNAVSDEIWAWHLKNGQGLAMFSPTTVNMGARDPRWGRIVENYGEDPYLVGQMAISTTHGMQGRNPRYLKTIACAKHFIANDTDTDRHVTSATVDPRSFWEYYTRGFEACVRQGHVFTVMSSYNAMNGIPTTANRFLLTELLRGRWGFRGYVVSDCGAVSDICRTHHFVPTLAEAAALAVNAGCDINCGDTLRKYLGEAVDKMLISESTLDHSLVRSFTGRVLLGEFDPPAQNPYSKTPVSCTESPAHRELAREAARQSIVLFKNENNMLPLDKSRLKKIAVVGPMADTCYLGGYSGMPLFRVSPLQGLKEYLGIPSGPTYQKLGSDFFRVGPGSKGPDWIHGPWLESSSVGGEALNNLDNGFWAAFRHVLFTGATEFSACIASKSAGGVIEVHLDSFDGPVVSKLEVVNTNGREKWANVSAPVTPVKGEHTVFLRFVGGAKMQVNLQSFKLTPERPLPPPAHAGTDLVYARGCSVVGGKDPAQFAAAVKAAQEADVALVFVGADEQVDDEAMDRDYIHLPGVQHELVQAVYAANPHTILVISSNCPVAVNWAQDHLPAIVGGMFLGEQQGHALAEVLFGDYNPGGKITTTWYRHVKDLPDFHDYNIFHGRTYMYFRGNPLYPFGHGRSYTTFQYKRLRIDQGTLRPGVTSKISFEITNSGRRDGDEIAQLYVHVDGGAVERPILQLVNFTRIHIKAGETTTVNFDLSYDDLAFRYWDETRYEFVVEPGMVAIMVGASSADIRLRGQVQLLAQ